MSDHRPLHRWQEFALPQLSDISSSSNNCSIPIHICLCNYIRHPQATTTTGIHRHRRKRYPHRYPQTPTGNHKQPLTRSNHRHRQQTDQPQVFTRNDRQSLTKAATSKHRPPHQKRRATSSIQLTNHKYLHAPTSNNSTPAVTRNDRQPLHSSCHRHRAATSEP